MLHRPSCHNRDEFLFTPLQNMVFMESDSMAHVLITMAKKSGALCSPLCSSVHTHRLTETSQHCEVLTATIRILQMRKLRLEETNKEKPKVSSVTRRSGWVGGYLGGSGRCCSHPHPQASWPARKEGLAQSRRLRDFLQQNCVSRLVQRRGGLGKPPLTGYSTVTTLDQKGETAFSREVHSAEERRLEKR